MDAAYHLGIHDTRLIYSWTPREFKNFVKAAQLRRIDSFELAAATALFNAVTKSKKRAKLSDIYDAEKARKAINSGQKQNKSVKNLELYRKAQEAMKNFKPTPLKKGG